jgi:hypothetical protein
MEFDAKFKHQKEFSKWNANNNCKVGRVCPNTCLAELVSTSKFLFDNTNESYSLQFI